MQKMCQIKFHYYKYFNYNILEQKKSQLVLWNVASIETAGLNVSNYDTIYLNFHWLSLLKTGGLILGAISKSYIVFFY